MTASLRSRLGELASSFAASVVDAIRGASLSELMSGASAHVRGGASTGASAWDGADAAAPARRRRAGRLPRRSAKQIENVVERIVALLKQHPRGLRAEQIRQKLGVQSKELPRPLSEALAGGLIAKSGRRRATTYSVKGAGAGGGATNATKAARKGGGTTTARKARRKSARKARREARPIGARRAARTPRAPRAPRKKKQGRTPKRAKGALRAKRAKRPVRRAKRSSTAKAASKGKRSRAVRMGRTPKPVQAAAVSPAPAVVPAAPAERSGST
jgi:hypothetical protein